MLLNCNLSNVSSWLNWVIYFWQEYYRYDTTFLLLVRNMMSICTIVSGGNFDHLFKGVSIQFLHCKLTIFPFAVNKYLETIHRCVLLIKILLSSFSIWWWLLAKAVFTVISTKWLLSLKKKRFYLFETEREHEWEEGQRERKKTPYWAGSPVWCDESQCRAQCKGPWDHKLSWRQMLNQLSHPSTPKWWLSNFIIPSDFNGCHSIVRSFLSP